MLIESLEYHGALIQRKQKRLTFSRAAVFWYARLTPYRGCTKRKRFRFRGLYVLNVIVE